MACLLGKKSFDFQGQVPAICLCKVHVRDIYSQNGSVPAVATCNGNWTWTWLRIWTLKIGFCWFETTLIFSRIRGGWTNNGGDPREYTNNMGMYGCVWKFAIYLHIIAMTKWWKSWSSASALWGTSYLDMAPAGMNGSTNYNMEFAYSNGVSSIYIYILYIIQTGSLTTIMQHLSAVISSVGDPWAPSAKIWRFGFDLRRIFRSC